MIRLSGIKMPINEYLLKEALKNIQRQLNDKDRKVRYIEAMLSQILTRISSLENNVLRIEENK